jgi:hypothetical protein
VELALSVITQLLFFLNINENSNNGFYLKLLMNLIPELQNREINLSGFKARETTTNIKVRYTNKLNRWKKIPVLVQVEIGNTTGVCIEC